MTVSTEARQAERARVLGEIVPGLAWAGSLESWLAGSPLAEIVLD
ncbi:hypothetical protein FB565_006210 [Actinoplanes lutulentus]|uniref:Uncharacterized protein n=1 Tax=Actinoplanes lutulentus TaxID=1287878 RepID=A0A327YW06_9ACTN|nr:hypothetical protein [Actinoplanes lutulentus]MBB2946442.1 hypothetical protein [Actinoplanes lutulentus]RAK25418.1 hypothetical protein B0I29_13428 [Actinoplanes lutulentus]